MTTTRWPTPAPSATHPGQSRTGCSQARNPTTPGDLPAELIGANAFIAAFVGGLAFGGASITVKQEHETAELLETASDLLGFVVWFFFGGILLLVFERGIRWQWVVIGVLALTVLRALPVVLAMIGSGFKWPTIAFLAWFGPRGLATIVFSLLALDELGPDSPYIGEVAGVLTVTVLMSVFAHGFTAAPLSQAYGERVENFGDPITVEPPDEAIHTRGVTGRFGPRLRR